MNNECGLGTYPGTVNLEVGSWEGVVMAFMHIIENSKKFQKNFADCMSRLSWPLDFSSQYANVTAIDCK